MPLQHDIDLGLYAGEDGGTITVSQQTPDGRYVVSRRHGAGAYILSAQTIRQLYPKFVGAIAAAAVLTFAGIADAKPASSALLARAAASVQATIKQTVMGPGGNFAPNSTFRVTCKGTTKRITCTAVKTSGAGPAFEESETFKVVHGKLQASTLTHAPMARIASANTPQSVAAQVIPGLRSQLTQRLKLISFEQGRTFRLVDVTLRCVPTPGAKAPWECATRYAVTEAAAHFTYAEMLNVWPGVRWASATNPTLINES